MKKLLFVTALLAMGTMAMGAKDLTTGENTEAQVEVEGKRNYFYTIGETRAFKGQTLEFDHEIKRLENNKANKVIITDVETGKVIKEIKIKK